MLVEFAGADFTVFNREGGFMDFITDLIKDKYGISRKDAWNPADIWLIKNVTEQKNRLEHAITNNRISTEPHDI